MTADYESWLAAATKDLVAEAASRVRAETAGRDVDSLGDPLWANVRYRRRYLTEFDAARIGAMCSPAGYRSLVPVFGPRQWIETKVQRMASRDAMTAVLESQRSMRAAIVLTSLAVAVIFAAVLDNPGIALGVPFFSCFVGLVIMEFHHGPLVRKLHNTGLAQWRPHAEQTAP